LVKIEVMSYGAIQIWLQMLRQGAIITVGAVMLGLSFNALREQGLSVVALWSMPQLDQEALEKLFIPVDKAQELFPLDEAVFVDARPRQLFEQGHITGALNLPLDLFEELGGIVLGNVSLDTPLIVYIEGTDSTPGVELALKLLSRNYRNVFVLEKGLDLWMAQGLPVEAVLFDSRHQ
jgi:rhodanese-related sulfurtransferase